MKGWTLVSGSGDGQEFFSRETFEGLTPDDHFYLWKAMCLGFSAAALYSPSSGPLPESIYAGNDAETRLTLMRFGALTFLRNDAELPDHQLERLLVVTEALLRFAESAVDEVHPDDAV